MAETRDELIKFTLETCCNCYMPFLVSARFNADCRKDGRTFYCPAGHGQHYRLGETEEQKLKRRLEEEQRRNERLNNAVGDYRQRVIATERSLSATKGVVTKLKTRIAAGVCPCCNRQFSEVYRHMQDKHPEFLTNEEIQFDAGIIERKPEDVKTPMTTAEAIRAIGKEEFTVADLLAFLKARGVERSEHSVATSLYVMAGENKITPVKGAGKSRVYKVAE